jgi:hypothetical protein
VLDQGGVTRLALVDLDALSGHPAIEPMEAPAA